MDTIGATWVPMPNGSWEPWGLDRIPVGHRYFSGVLMWRGPYEGVGLGEEPHGRSLGLGVLMGSQASGKP